MTYTYLELSPFPVPLLVRLNNRRRCIEGGSDQTSFLCYLHELPANSGWLIQIPAFGFVEKYTVSTKIYHCQFLHHLWWHLMNGLHMIVYLLNLASHCSTYCFIQLHQWLMYDGTARALFTFIFWSYFSYLENSFAKKIVLDLPSSIFAMRYH